MSWFTKFLTSSLGQKLIMSLTGLFLILFLVIHLAGNLQLLLDDGGQAFNVYTKKMTTSPIIKTVSYGLYAFILIHAIQGLVLWSRNRAARGGRYAVNKVRTVKTNSFAANNMAMLGLLVLVFLGIHMGDFWFKMKFGEVNMVPYADGVEYKNLYEKVEASFSQLWIVAVYVISMIGLGFHLLHGFQSAFQTLGINHKKYTPFIKSLGRVFSIVVPLLFAVIPLYFYFFKG